MSQFFVPQLESLFIGGHNFNEDDLSHLFDFINLNTTIFEVNMSKIIFDNMMLNVLFKKVLNNNVLRKINLSNCYLGNTDINDILLQYYEGDDESLNTHNNKIEMLDLAQNGINQINFHKIIDMNVLQYLNLEKNEINQWNKNFDLFCFFPPICKYFECSRHA